jgi:tetraacyldisaccharide-1-P 4'-kinase
VVSRGYGAKPPQLPWRVEADQRADQAGDEPLLIVQRTGVPLMIDPDRSRRAGVAGQRTARPDPVRRRHAALPPGP